MIWKIQKKLKSNSEKIGKYGENPYFPYVITIQLIFLPYFPYLYTIQLSFLPYFPNHFTIQQIFLDLENTEENSEMIWRNMEEK
jgi:hypothetical protein